MRLAVPESSGVCIARFWRRGCAAVQSAGSPSPPSRARHAGAGLCLAAALALGAAAARADQECGQGSSNFGIDYVKTEVTCSADNYDPATEADIRYVLPKFTVTPDTAHYTFDNVVVLDGTLRGDKAIRPAQGTAQDVFGEPNLANPSAVDVRHRGKGLLEIRTAADIEATYSATHSDEFGTFTQYQYGIYASRCPLPSGDCEPEGDIEVSMTDGTIRSANAGIYIQNDIEAGSARVRATGGRIETTGDMSGTDVVGHGIYAQSSQSGDVLIDTRNLVIGTKGYASAGVRGYNWGGTGRLDLHVLDGTSIVTEGRSASGVYATRRDRYDFDISAFDYVRVGDGGDIEAHLANARIETKNRSSHGVNAWHQGHGRIVIGVTGGVIDTRGLSSYGIYGYHRYRFASQPNSGDIDIRTRGAVITTAGNGASGIFGWNRGGGSNDGVLLSIWGDTRIETRGDGAYGMYGRRDTGGAGDVRISLRDATIATHADDAHGIFAFNDSASEHTSEHTTGRTDVTVGPGATVTAGGRDASGVLTLTFVDADGDGFRDQAVTVGGSVTGGSGDGTGIRLVGGGTVVIDETGSAGAQSGVAISSTGPLKVDVRLAGRKGGDAVKGVIRNTGTTTVRAKDAAEDDWTTLLDKDTVQDRSVRSGGYRVSIEDAEGADTPGSARDWRFADMRVTDPPGPDPDVERTPSTRSGSSSGSETAVLGFGALFALIAAGDILLPVLLDDDEESSGLADAASVPGFAAAKTRFAAGGGARHAVRVFDPGAPRLAGGAAVRVGGGQSLFDWPLGSGFRAGMSMAPDLSVSLPQAGPAGSAALRGGRYSVFGGWRGEYLSARATLAHDDWEARTSTANPLAEGALAGAFGLRRTDARLDLGARGEIGPARLRLSAAAFGGEAVQEAHTARGPVYDAAMPERNWRYSGWKAGLGVASSGRLEGGEARWRTGLNMSVTGLSADGQPFELAQRDRAGFLSFSGTVRPETAPQTVFALGTAAELATACGWRLRLGYAGMAADEGAPVHMAGASANLRF